MTEQVLLTLMFQRLAKSVKGAPRDQAAMAKIASEWYGYISRNTISTDKLDEFATYWIENRSTWPTLSAFAEWVKPPKSARPGSFSPKFVVQEIRSVDGIEIVRYRLWHAAADYKVKQGEFSFDTEAEAKKWYRQNGLCSECGWVDRGKCACWPRRAESAAAQA